MHNKKIIAKGLALGLVLSNTPIDSIANVVDEYNLSREEKKKTNLKKEEKEDKVIEMKESIDDFFKNLFNRDDNKSNYKSNKEIIKVNPNIRAGTVLEIRLSDNQFVEDLSGNPGGYETVKVITEGAKKLVKEDYDNLRLSGIPKVDLSNAYSDVITEGAFSNATHLIEFKFPIGVKRIENGNSVSSGEYSGAFYNCYNLSGELVIPDTIVHIGNYAFRQCSGLTGNVIIPNSVITIGNSVFKGCSGFNGNLVIGNSVKSIGYEVFYGCIGLVGNLTIPSSVTYLGDSAFWGCSGFNGRLLIETGLTFIPRYAFYKCSGLTGELAIPSEVITIGEGAFSNCTSFTGDLIISDSVISIDRFAFSNCSGFDGELVLSNSITTLEQNVFYGCNNLTGDLVIPDSVISIGNNAFYECYGFNGNLLIPDSVTSIGYSAFSYCKGLVGSLVIPDSVTSIGDSAFYNCIGFTGNLTIPNSVTSIGKYTFKGCNGFNGTLTIQNSIKTIGEGAFSYCKGLVGSLVIPDSITSIGDYVFYGCSGFNGNLVIPDSVTSIGNSAFEECSGFDGNLVIPDSVTSLGNNVFKRCSNLIGNLVIPNSVVSIGEGAFYRCGKLAGDLVIPSSVTNIGNTAFYGCSKLAGNVVIPDSVTSVGTNAFLYCDGIEKIIIKVDSLDSNTNYKKTMIDNLPVEITYIEMPYDLDISNTWLKSTSHKKAQPTISTYAGTFNNNEGAGVILNILEASPITVFTIEKDGEAYSLNKDANNNYIFKESGNYQVYVETELGTKSNIEFKNISPVNHPNINVEDNNFNLISNGIIGDINVNCDALEYRVNNGEWQIYNGSFKLDYPIGTKLKIDVRAKHDGYVSEIFTQNITIEISIEDIERAVAKAEQSKSMEDISNARDMVNSMSESLKKDEFQNRLNNVISSDITIQKKQITFGSDIYIKFENSLTLTLETNSILFDDFDGTEDVERLRAINLTVTSSLPYKIKAYLPDNIKNLDGTNTINNNILNIRATGQMDYNVFRDNINPIVLLDNQLPGKHTSHGIDLMLKGRVIDNADIYRAIIKFEIEQN